MFTAIVYVAAQSSSINFITEISDLKCGDTFTSTITISSSNILNGIQLSLDFDKDVFEFQKAELQDPDEYAFFGSSAESIEILSVKGSTTPLILHITWKVKDDVKTGNYKITAPNIQISYMENDEIEQLESPSLDLHINGIINSRIIWIVSIGALIIMISSVVFVMIRKHTKVL